VAAPTRREPAIWSDPADDAADEAWTRAAMATAEPHAMSYYVGESDLLAAPDRARRCLSEARWPRLREVRTGEIRMLASPIFPRIDCVASPTASVIPPSARSTKQEIVRSTTKARATNYT
jgi:hypothetical protein